MTDEEMSDDLDYGPVVREGIGEVLSATPPGEWGALGLCPGPFGCPYTSIEAAIAAGVEENFCPSCRVILLYRPRPDQTSAPAAT